MAGALGGCGYFCQYYGSDCMDSVWIFPRSWLDEWCDFCSVRPIILSPVGAGRFRVVRCHVEAAEMTAGIGRKEKVKRSRITAVQFTD